MEKDKVIEEIEKLKTIKEKLQFYNDNYSTLAKVETYHHKVGFNTLDNKNIFCLCKKCEGLYTLTDFETYRDLRNQETNRIINFFESNIEYIDKVEHHFKLHLNYRNTKTELVFIPDSLDKIKFNEFPYKSHIVDITPQTQKEIDILKNFLKNKLLKNPDRIYNLNQLTLEYRVENLKKFLNVRQEKNRRAELIQAEYDKIDLNKAKNLKTFNISKVLEILKTVDDIIKGKYLNNYTNFSDIEIEILAEDAIKYEEYLNSLTEIKPIENEVIETKESIFANEITIFEKIKRELNIIHWVFKSQFQKKSKDINFPILHQDGRYCTNIYIRSNDELLTIEKYKNHYIQRFEGTQNTSLVKNELIQIHEKALFLRDFYNENFTKGCHIFDDYIDKTKKHKNLFDIADDHTMIITVENFNPIFILFGFSGILPSEETRWTAKKYNFGNCNVGLVDICQKLIAFIDNFEIINTKNNEQNTASINNQTLNENEINNLLKSTIEDYLDEFKDEINSNGYQILVDCLFHYFTKNEFPALNNKIHFKKINKKRIGWALKELYKCEKTDTIPLEYILFAKNNINLFFNEIIENDNFRKSKLYKAFTTNPAK